MQQQGHIRNLFVLGDNAFNEEHQLRPLSEAYGYNYHTLTRYRDSTVDARPALETLRIARERLAAFDGSVDGLITFFDFPVSILAPMLCREFGLPSPSVQSVLHCEHKYLSRRLQREVAPEAVPAFARVDPDRDAADTWHTITDAGLDTPFWIKPCKGFLSMLAFRIESRGDLDEALEQIRQSVDRFAEPLERLLDAMDVDLPEGLDHRTAARLFIAEEDIATSMACTVEGHRFEGQTRLHGVVDSYRYPGTSVFQRYQYPSHLPPQVRDRMLDVSARVLDRFGFDGGAFNIEYFWDPRTDRLSLLEVNPRISQSHAPQFRMVDGDANMKVITDLALGQQPTMGQDAGEHAMAAKFMLRSFVQDGTVTRSPGQADIAAVRRQFPGTLVLPTVSFGHRLSEQRDADSYSWLLAEIYMGGRNEEELLAHFLQAADMLGFRIDGKPVELCDARDLMSRPSERSDRPFSS
ncbi:MAG: acetyl-CoA carboxylase biotin carboxylase subunit family protein [Phycisphaerales bacterium JB060]